MLVSASPVPLLEPLNLIKPYCSPEAKVFPPAFRHPQCLWSAIVGNYYVLMYNTNLVSKVDAPRDWGDLLNSKWRGEKIGIDPEEFSWLAGMEAYLGEEKTKSLMTALAKQGIGGKKASRISRSFWSRVSSPWGWVTRRGPLPLRQLALRLIG